MNTLRFKIFTPSNYKFKITENVIVYGLWAFGIGLFFICVKIDVLRELLEPYKEIYLFTVLVLSIYFTITAFFRHKALNGIIKGYLEIDLDKIVIDDKIYLVKNISKMNFHFIDYYGQLSRYESKANYNPLLSQGVSNFIEFTDESKHTYKIYFRLDFKNQHQVLFPFITDMIKLKKISFLRGIEILGINDYNEIQEFKKSLIAI